MNSCKHKFILLLFAFLLTLTPNSYAQEVSEAEIIATYIYNFAKNISWPNNKKIKYFNITSIAPTSTELIDALKDLSKAKKINDVSVKVTFTSDLDKLETAHLAYIESPDNLLIEETYKRIKGKPILLVTKGCSNKRLVMINLLKEEDHIVFEVNKANIINQNLTTLPNLILHGGTEIDVAKLYKESQNSLAALELELHKREGKLNTLSNSIKTQEEKIIQQIKELKKDQEIILSQKTSLLEQDRKLSKQTESLRKQNEKINKQNKEIDLSEKRIQDIRNETKESADLLVEQKQEIQDQYKRIEQLGGQLATQASVVRLLQIVVLLTTFLVFAIVIGYRNKRRDNLKLNKQREELEKALKDLKSTEVQLVSAKDEAIMASAAKSEFLANMSHEIRTPMNAVMGFTEVLLSEETDDYKKECLNSVRAGGKALLTLINDILDLSKIEAGKFELQYKAISLKASFKQLESIFAIKAKEKGLDISIEADNNVPDVLILDDTRFRQVLTNLLSNAIKFTESGYIRLKASTKDQNTKHCSQVNLKVTVEDTGIGIPKSQQDKIFEPFEQAKGQSIQKYGGTGLGLAITQNLVKLMGGEISLKSTPGRGTKFDILLKHVEVAATEDISREQALIDFDKIDFRPSTILIADDIDYNRQLLSAFLAQWNFNIIEAENGKEVLKLAYQNKLDLILLDMKMPVMNGFQTAEILNNDTKLNHIPKIAITAHALKRDEGLISRLCDGYLKKPVSKSDLVRILMRFIPTTDKNQENKKS